MAKLDLSKLSAAELKDVEREAAKRLKELEQGKRKEVYRAMRDLAAQAGTTPEALVAEFGPKRRAKLKPKYKHPDNPKQTWTGRGPKPAWLKALLEQGAKLEDLAL